MLPGTMLEERRPCSAFFEFKSFWRFNIWIIKPIVAVVVGGGVGVTGVSPSNAYMYSTIVPYM
jgi:hypothetical protein